MWEMAKVDGSFLKKVFLSWHEMGNKIGLICHYTKHILDSHRCAFD